MHDVSHAYTKESAIFVGKLQLQHLEKHIVTDHRLCLIALSYIMTIETSRIQEINREIDLNTKKIY